MARGLGSGFGRLWAAYAVSTAGTWLAFDAFPLVAVLVLHAGPAAVSALAAAGLAVSALVAVPLGAVVEFRRKRRVMIATDLLRGVALTSVPVAYALGSLTLLQLLVVAVTVGAADVAFAAASGALLRSVVRPEDLLSANGRLESTAWTATALGPPLGGAAIGLLGPVVTTLANAVSFLVSALCLRGLRDEAPPPPRRATLHRRDLLEGWRHVLGSPALRPLFLNAVLVNGLVLATSPLLAVLMLGRLGVSPLQYGLVFGAPCVGGLVGSRLARPLAARYGQLRVLRRAGTLRAVWSLGLALVGSGTGGLVLVLVVQLGLVTCMGVFTPVLATYRLEQTPPDRVARTLAAWSVTSRLTIAGTTALWGLLAGLTSARTAIAAAGLLLLATPLLLPRAAQGSSGETAGGLLRQV